MARAVLKDAATKEQVHLIQEHLTYLAKDFDRFQDRMDKLATHIRQANDDVENVNKSAKKISSSLREDRAGRTRKRQISHSSAHCCRR